MFMPGQSQFGGMRGKPAVAPPPQGNSISARAQRMLYYIRQNKKAVKLAQTVVMFLGTIVVIRKYGHYLDAPQPDPKQLHDQFFPPQAVEPQFQSPQQYPQRGF